MHSLIMWPQEKPHKKIIILKSHLEKNEAGFLKFVEGFTYPTNKSVMIYVEAKEMQGLQRNRFSHLASDLVALLNLYL